ncbi:MAG: hypothetical protein RR620_00165 [Clostridium sp.]
MKSNKGDLRKRGMIEDIDVEVMFKLSLDELLKFINSSVAVERTSSIRVLSLKGYTLDEKVVELLLERLMIEKSLYTKIEIGTFLEKGNVNVAEKMINYLGKIGNNQYKSLPDKVSKKISYPLPRDIISRSLGRMNIEILPKLLAVLESRDEEKISEVIDAIGFLIFYNEKSISIEIFNTIIKTMEIYSENELIIWKCTTCLSAFPLIETVYKLNVILDSNNNEIIRTEARRSLNIISDKLNKNIENYV